MSRIVLVAAALTIGCATPALAQHEGHGTPPTAPVLAQAADDPACPAEHAAMGHCTPKPVPTPPDLAPPSAPAVNPHAGHDRRGSTQAPKSAVPPAAPQVIAGPACSPEHAAMGHCALELGEKAHPAAPSPSAPARQTGLADPACPPEHAAMGHCTPKAGGSGTAPPVGPPPQAAFSGPEHAADTVWDPQLMARKRANKLIAEHGGYTGYMVLLDQLEYRVQDGRDGFAWDGQGWYGGDYNRLWLKTEGEGEFGGALEAAEIQALYSRAIRPWVNLQAGVRHDIRPKPERTHLVLGIQGLAPYWFEIDAAAFLSQRGDLTARVEAEYDQRLTNWLILQPRVELDFAARNAPELGIGSGLSSFEAEFRLRYEIRREFAPYVGVHYERRVGDTADFARAAGEDVGKWSFIVGLRSWF